MRRYTRLHITPGQNIDLACINWIRDQAQAQITHNNTTTSPIKLVLEIFLPGALYIGYANSR